MKLSSVVFSNNLLSLIKSSGKSRAETAEDLGTPRGTISRWLSAERIPDPQYLVNICEHYGVTLEWLLGIDDTSTKVVISEEIRSLINLYQKASDSDKLVIRTILSKYND